MTHEPFDEPTNGVLILGEWRFIPDKRGGHLIDPDGVKWLSAKTLEANNLLAAQAKVAELEAENIRLIREIDAAKQYDPQFDTFRETFDWSVLARLDRLEQAEAEVERLRSAMRVACNLLVDAWPGDVRDAHGILDAALAGKGEG